MQETILRIKKKGGVKDGGKEGSKEDTCSKM